MARRPINIARDLCCQWIFEFGSLCHWFIGSRTMLRSVLHFPLGHPAIGHRRANVAFSACRHFHITQLCRAARKQTVDSDTPSETPEPRKRRRNLPKPTREVELTDDRITLPNPLDWRSVFPPIKLKDRISVSNPDTAAEMAEAFVPEGSKDKVVIEAFPGEK